jgi:hypothetical protein
MISRDTWELWSFIVTALGLPVAIIIFMWQQRKERENEDEEGYQLLSNAYNDFLKVVLAHPDLQLRSNAALPNATPEQVERMLVIFDMLISLFERAYLVAWNSWDDYMRGWCRLDDFHSALPLLLRGEDPDFQIYIRRVAGEERGNVIQAA